MRRALARLADQRYRKCSDVTDSLFKMHLFHAGRNIVSGNKASRAGRRRYRAIFWPTPKFRTRYRFRIPHHSIGAAKIAEQAGEFERP